MMNNHSFIHPKARLGQDVTVGPFCYIGPDVVIGDNCVLESHVVMKGPCFIGSNNHFFQFCSIGEACQDKKYNGEPTRLTIGDNNVFRECVSVHRGTIQDAGETVIGNDNLMMAYTHIAHDCRIGNHIVFSNSVGVAGHCQVDDWAIIGGMSGIHQYVRIGAHAFVAGCSVVRLDVPAFVMAAGFGAEPKGLNTEGMKRRGYSSEEIQAMRKTYRIFYRSGLSKDDALTELLEPSGQYASVMQFTQFIKSSKRGFIRS
jgi:UDP-N-acetylglucosamine acyltransferase